MSLYDAYGRLIPESPKLREGSEASQKDPQESIKSEPSDPKPELSLLQKLKRPWAIVTQVLTLLGLLTGFLVWRQEISVDPSISYDTSDPFNQRFLIANNGPWDMSDVHYACVITHIEITLNSLVDETTQVVPWVMLPVAPHVPELEWKQKISTDCDFAARYGAALRAARIEIEVFYKRWGFWRRKGPGWKFSGKRDQDGKFMWDYGSADSGLLQQRNKKTVIVMPFLARCAPFDVELAKQDLKEFIALLHEYGYIVATTTMTPCGTPKGN